MERRPAFACVQMGNVAKGMTLAILTHPEVPRGMCVLWRIDDEGDPMQAERGQLVPLDDVERML